MSIGNVDSPTTCHRFAVELARHAVDVIAAARPSTAHADTKVDVKNVDRGVSITMTSADPATATRLQKMAEAMRLMHEAMQQ